MDSSKIEMQVREMLVPVFGLNGIEEILPDHSLVNDLDAESLDFAEIMYLIEDTFGVDINFREIIGGSPNEFDEEIFKDRRLTEKGVIRLQKKFPHSANKIQIDMADVDIFQIVTVRDLARLIQDKLVETGIQ
jgi:acyl carrier protein